MEYQERHAIIQSVFQLVVSVQNWVTSQFRSLDNFSEFQIFAHPSHYLVESAFSLATKVIGKRAAKNGSNTSYVINDGIFGAFGRLLHDDDVTLEPMPLKEKNGAKEMFSKCDVYGPSGHDMDQVLKQQFCLLYYTVAQLHNSVYHVKLKNFIYFHKILYTSPYLLQFNI